MNEKYIDVGRPMLTALVYANFVIEVELVLLVGWMTFGQVAKLVSA
jgi:hypothetical protein